MLQKGKRIPSSQRRQQIIEQSAELFAMKGLDGTKTREIAAHCKVNEALIYSHFRSKEELYSEAMKFLHDRLMRESIEKIEKAPDGLSALKYAIGHIVEVLSENPYVAANFHHAVTSGIFYPEMQNQVSERVISSTQFLKSLIERGIKDGSIDPSVNPSSAAWSIGSIIYFYSIIVILRIEEMLNEGISEVISAIIDNLAKPCSCSGTIKKSKKRK